MSNTTSPNMNSSSSSSVSDDNESPSPDLTGYGYYTFGLSIGVLLLFCLMTVAMYYFSSRRNPTTDTNETITAAGDHHHHLSPPSRAAAGVDDSTLRSYPAVLYSELAKSWKLQLDDWDWRRGCSICLGDYKESEWVRVLPECAHLFHRNCIDVWLRMNSSCPLCRNSPLPSPIAQVAPLVPTRG